MRFLWRKGSRLKITFPQSLSEKIVVLEWSLQVILSSSQVDAWMPGVLNFAVGWACTWVQPPCLLRCPHPRRQTINGCPCRVTCLLSGEAWHPGKSPFPSTFLCRCAARIKYNEFFLKSSDDRKLNRKEERISKPLRASALGVSMYKVTRQVLILVLSFHFSTKVFLV